MKKITIVGRGTVGCIAVAHFLRWSDWEIDWVFDPKIETASVGEATTLLLPRALSDTVRFDSRDMDAIGATPKMGIWKRGWGNGEEFYHTFPAGSIGMHFNAVQFQDHMFNKLSDNTRVNLIESNATDYENMESDFVMVCSGSPKDLDDYIVRDSIPVNSCVVFQCPWDYTRFNYSITFARRHGWVFGIPLKNRCSIGYLYNNKFTTPEEIKEDVQELLDEFNLTPSFVRELKFNNYSRETNFTDRVVYNGNASFFLEPLEATSTGFAHIIMTLAFSLWESKSITKDLANATYNKYLNDIESMICLHYCSGSMYDSDFWQYAQRIGDVKITDNFIHNTEFASYVKDALTKPNYYDCGNKEIGSWGMPSYKMNIDGLGITNKIMDLIHQYRI